MMADGGDGEGGAEDASGEKDCVGCCGEAGDGEATGTGVSDEDRV